MDYSLLLGIEDTQFGKNQQQQYSVSLASRKSYFGKIMSGKSSRKYTKELPSGTNSRKYT